MKTTKYILNGNFINIDGIVSENVIFKPITIIMGSAVAIFGILILMCVLPCAIMIDNGRYIKLQYYLHIKERRKYRTLYHVLKPLSVTQRETKQLILLLSTN